MRGSGDSTPKAVSPDSTVAAGVARLWRRHHRIVWWCVLLQLAFALLFTVAAPPYRGPDEARQVDMIRHYRSHAGFPSPAVRPLMSPGVAATEASLGPSHDPRPPLEADDAPPRAHRPTFAELDETADVPRAKNQLSQHPPLYYAVVGGTSVIVDSLAPAELWSWDREAYLYRLLSVALTSPLPLLASSAALALGLGRPSGAVAAAFTMLIPMATFMGSVANNDALLMVLAAAAVVAALRYWEGGGRRWAVAAAAGAAGVMLTKMTGASLAPWVLGVIGIALLRRRRTLSRRQVVGTLAAVGVVLAVGAAWALSNLVRFQDLQPSGIRLENPSGTTMGLIDFARGWYERVSATFWGRPGFHAGVTLGSYTFAILTAAAAVTAAAALLVRRHRSTAVLLWALVGGQAVLLFSANWNSHLRSGSLPGAQGRYLYALLVPLAVLVSLGARHVVSRVRRVTTTHVAVLMVVAGVGLHAELAVRMVGGFWAEPGAPWSQNLVALRAWSPLPEPATNLALVLPVAVVAAGAVALARHALRRAGPPAGATA